MEAPQYHRGQDLPYGGAQQANAATPSPVAGLEEAAHKFVFERPTDQPDVPVTNGMPFGPGASHVQYAHEDENTMRQRVANSLLTSPSADPDVKRFAQRMLNGE